MLWKQFPSYPGHPVQLAKNPWYTACLPANGLARHGWTTFTAVPRYLMRNMQGCSVPYPRSTHGARPCTMHTLLACHVIPWYTMEQWPWYRFGYLHYTINKSQITMDTMVYQQNIAVSWYTIAVPGNGMPWIRLSQVSMVYHGMLWYTMVVPWYTMVSWYTMVCHGIPWYTMVYDGSYHRRP